MRESARTISHKNSIKCQFDSTLQEHQRIRTNATVSKDSEMGKIRKKHGGQWEFSHFQTSSLCQ